MLADELGEDRPAGAVLGDGAENVLLRPRLGVHAEELGEEIIRRAIMSGDPHEGQVGDVLHRRERGDRLAGEDAGREG